MCDETALDHVREPFQRRLDRRRGIGRMRETEVDPGHPEALQARGELVSDVARCKIDRNTAIADDVADLRCDPYRGACLRCLRSQPFADPPFACAACVAVRGVEQVDAKR